MAYDTSKLIKLAALKVLAEKIKADYTLNSDFTELQSQVSDLVSTGGEPNVLEGVKVNGNALAIADKMVDILIATGVSNGTIKVNGADVAVKGLAALAYKAQVSEADLDEALKAVIAAKASQADVSTLIGTDTGKSVRTIANEELAAQLIPEGAQESLDTLTEIAQWIQEHPDDAAAMNSAISKLQEIVDGIGDGGDSYTTVVDAIDKKIEAALADISAGATKVEASEINGNIKIDGEETTVYTHPVTSAQPAAFVKVGNNESGHVVIGDPITKEDITGLGIPAQDTTYSPAVASGADGLLTGTDKAKLDGVAANATKVEAGTADGQIKINGVDTSVVNIASDVEVTEMLDEVFTVEA